MPRIPTYSPNIETEKEFCVLVSMPLYGYNDEVRIKQFIDYYFKLGVDKILFPYEEYESIKKLIHYNKKVEFFERPYAFDDRSCDKNRENHENSIIEGLKKQKIKM
eukprot:UN23204